MQDDLGHQSTLQGLRHAALYTGVWEANKEPPCFSRNLDARNLLWGPSIAWYGSPGRWEYIAFRRRNRAALSPWVQLPLNISIVVYAFSTSQRFQNRGHAGFAIRHDRRQGSNYHNVVHTVISALVYTRVPLSPKERPRHNKKTHELKEKNKICPMIPTQSLGNVLHESQDAEEEKINAN